MDTWRCCCLAPAAGLLLAAAQTALAGPPPDPRINEVRVGQVAEDTDEYFELAGTAGTSLTGMFYVEITDDAGNNGVVGTVVNLFNQSIRPSGFFLAVENSFTLGGAPNLFLPAGELFQGGNATHLLVTNFTGQEGQDLDLDDDGTLDLLPWDAITDCIALVGPGVPGTDGPHVYCATQVGPDGDFTPGHAYRCDPDLTWTVGEFDINDPGATDTPGAVNTSCDFVPPCGSGLAGDCFVPNGTPNCDDQQCCKDVIGFDPTCADVWDQFCADLAQLQCRSCGDPEAGSCFEPNGTAYCDLASCCDTVCAIDASCCNINGWDQACADLAIANCEIPGVQQGDVIIGLSNADPDLTLAIARGDAIENGGALADDAWTQTFIQSVELDNLGGVSHNPDGNLIAVNFGAFADGGSIYSLPACDAVGPGELIGDTLGLGGAGVTQTRLAGVSVSPDNTKLAVVGYDTGKVLVYDYAAADCLGAGASLSGARETSTNPMCLADTQGTAWLDNDTVLAFSSTGDVWSIDATTMDATAVASLPTTCGPAVTDIEYNPEVSPFVFCMDGEFSGATLNTLWILDPAGSFAIVNQLDYSTSMDTTREIGLDRSGNLFVTQFSGIVDVILGAGAGAAEGTLMDNDSLDWFDTETNVTFASFSGLDVAVGGGGKPCPWDCADEGPDGIVGITDFLDLLAQWQLIGTSCDLDFGDPGVGIEEFLAQLANWGECP